MKKIITAIFDTECVGLTQKYLYDIGVVIADSNKILKKLSFLVEEVYTNPSLMKKSYYSNKVFTDYPRLLEKGQIKIKKYDEIKKIINETFEEYNVTKVAAYNLPFDAKVLENTAYFLSKPLIFNVHDYDFVDIWLAACEVLGTTKKYKNFCRENDFVSAKGNIQTSAETFYRYIINDPHFSEDHTGLSDALIEHEILNRVKEQKKKYTQNKIKHFPWKIVNPKPLKKTWQ